MEDKDYDSIDELFADMIPTGYKLPPRPCCGAEDDASYDVARDCAYGNCTVLYCRCGRSTESGYGSIGCRCQLEAPAHWRVFERQMISIKKVGLSTAKKRARQGRG